MQCKLGLPFPPFSSEFFPLQQVVRAYRNWDSSRFSIHPVRVVLSAVAMKKPWERVLEDNASLVCVSDVAMAIFAFIFGLRESSVMGIMVNDFSSVLTSRKGDIVLRKMKGRTSEKALRRGSRIYTVQEGSQNMTALTVLENIFGLRNSSPEFLFPRKTPLLDV